MLVLLCILIFVHHFSNGLYVAGGLEPALDLATLYDITFVCGAVWWLRADTRSSIMKHVYCLGVLVGVGAIIIIPYHLIKTRGARGLIPLSILIASYVSAYVAAVFVYAILSTGQ